MPLLAWNVSIQGCLMPKECAPDEAANCKTALLVFGEWSTSAIIIVTRFVKSNAAPTTHTADLVSSIESLDREPLFAEKE